MEGIGKDVLMLC